jgi:hypothetical protein
MRTNMEHASGSVKLLAARNLSGTTLSRSRFRKNATVMERTTLRHLTPEEIALNQLELTCRAEIEKLEMQEAQLDTELDQDIDESPEDAGLVYSKSSLQGAIG